MNFKEIYRYRLLILLAMIAVIMGLIKWQYRNVIWESEDKLITPTIMPTSAPQINKNYPLWEFIPYSGKGFVVDHYTEPLVLLVKLEERADQKESISEIYKWMVENKVATESHKLIFEKAL